MKMDVTATPGLDPALSVTAQLITLTRGRLLKVIDGLTDEQLQQVPAGFGNSIAALLLHVGAVETNFAHRLLGRDVPAEVKATFKLDQPQNPLPAAAGETAETLKAKLEHSLGYVRQALQGLTAADLEREIPMGSDRTATVRYALAVLANHQAQHLGQAQMIRKFL